MTNPSPLRPLRFLAPFARNKRSQPTEPHHKPNRRGGALISVLWLTAALSAIAFSVGALVRGEIERATNSSEGTRAYFLARGAMERLMYEIERTSPAASATGPAPGALTNRLGHIDRYQFGDGDVVVEIVAESGKVNINSAPPEHIQIVLAELGLPLDRAAALTAAIVDWRGNPALGQAPMATEFDQVYLQRQPSFRPARASFQEIEDLLLVHGVTPELFYGGYRIAPNGAFVPRPGLRDCFSAYRGGEISVDVMSATAPVLASYGIPREAAEAFVAERQLTDAFAPERLMAFLAPAAVFTERTGGAFGMLQITGGRAMYTLRATGRVNGTIRSIAALIQLGARQGRPFDIVRWEDQALIPANLFPEKTEGAKQ
jgi:general secretion pathway protein K